MNSMADPAERPERTLNSIAEELYSKHGSIHAALQEMVRIVVADPALASEAIRRACQQALGVAQGTVRAEAYHGVTPRERQAAAATASDTTSPEYHSRRVRALGKENLLNFPLADGTPLRMAKKEQVRKSANAYLERGRDETVKGTWLSYVASGLRATERVGQRYKEADLKRLKDKAIRDTQPQS
jgi:hypothetical protein